MAEPAAGQSVQRYYDAGSGRFLSVDPVGPLHDPLNHFGRYHYANNNPYKFVDPDGRASEMQLDRLAETVARNPEAFEPLVPVAIAGTAIMAAPIAIAVLVVPDPSDVVLAAAVAKVAGTVAKSGRAVNKLAPDPKAAGPHSPFKHDADGKITNTATYNPNARNPSGFQEVKRVDVTGKAHTNPDGTVVPTPHVKEAGTKGVRPAKPEEIPRR